jgi:hypothetical protein
MKRNKFKRALHHLNKKHVVESAPTNNTLGVFSVTPSGVGPVGWTDRTFTTDISGNPLPKLAAADFTVGENPENSTEAQDTSGLFEDDGTIKTLTPPGDNSYILGPFASMWYAWGNFTTLGYIRQSDRKMVNLGTITGKLSDWNGASINSYGQLTLEQALWFRDVDKFGGIDNDPANHNYRAFYPGPPSNTPDAFGRYRCVLAASREVGGTETRPGSPDNPTEKGAMSADDNFSAQSRRNKRGSGMRNRGREGVNIPGADNQRGIGARINTGDPEMDRGLGQLFQRGSQALRGAIQSLSGTLRGLGGRSTGLGGAVELGFHGTSRSAARNIRGSGFRPGSRQNIFGTRGTFVAPSPRQTGGSNLIPQAARDFSRRGGEAGRGAISRGFGRKSSKAGSILPVVTPTGSGVRSRIPGTKFAEVGVNQKTANRGLRLGQNIIKGKYPNSAKANQLLKLGKTTNAAKGARGLAKTAGRLAPGVGIALAGIDVAQRGNQARQNFKNGNFAAASLDIAGAGLGALTAIPGPVGWAALAAQATLDIGRAKGVGNRVKGRVSRSNQRNSYDLDGDILLEHELGGYLLVEQDDENYTIEDEDKENLQGYMSLLVQELRKALPVVGDIDDEDEEFLQNLEAGEIGAPEDLEKIMKILEKLQSGGKDYDKKQVKESFNCGKKNLLREIVIPEAKKKYKVKPKVLGHPSNKTLSNQMKDTTPNVAFKKEIPVWSMDQKIRNARSSQEKKNEVLEYLGSSGDHWNYMTKAIKEHNKKIINLNYGGKKKKVTRKEQVDKDTLVFMEDDLGKKSSVLQSKINEMQAEAGDKEMFAKYYEMNPQKKSLFKEVVKRGVFDYKGKPSKKGYPDKEPVQLDPNTGMHPEYGKKVKHDKLDPHSAESMPMQGDPEIDANITKNLNPESKKRKTKILNQPNG